MLECHKGEEETYLLGLRWSTAGLTAAPAMAMSEQALKVSWGPQPREAPSIPCSTQLPQLLPA